MSELIAQFTDQQIRNYRADKYLIKQGLSVYFEVGTALLEIFTEKLYLIEYSSFKAFLEAECEIEGMAIHYEYARKLMRAASVTQNLISANEMSQECPSGTIVPLPIPRTEYTTRPLQNLPPERQVEVYREAVSRNGGEAPPARIIQEVIHSQTPTPLTPKQQMQAQREEMGLSAPEMTQEQKSRLGEEKQTFDGIEGYKNRAPAKSGRGYVDPVSLRWDGQRLWYVHIQPRMAPHKPLKTPCSIAGHHLSAIGIVLPELPQTHPLNKEHTEEPYDFYADEEQVRQNYENNQPQKTEEEIVREYERRRKADYRAQKREQAQKEKEA